MVQIYHDEDVDPAALDGLNVACSAMRDLLIARIGHMSPGVPGNRLDNALDLFKVRFRAPETTTGKDGGFGHFRLAGHGVVHLFIH